jgi:putative ABC transport system permease protein
LESYVVLQVRRLHDFLTAASHPVQGTCRTLTISLRKSFRQRVRLFSVICLLACTGGIFISSLNVRHATEEHLIAAAAERHYDLEIQLPSPAKLETISNFLKAIAGVVQVESWRHTPAARHRADGLNIAKTYFDGSHGLLNVAAIAAGSRFLTLPMREGHWLDDPSDDAVVLNLKALEVFAPGDGHFRATKIGDQIRLGADGRIVEATFAARL